MQQNKFCFFPTLQKDILDFVRPCYQKQAAIPVKTYKRVNTEGEKTRNVIICRQVSVSNKLQRKRFKEKYIFKTKKSSMVGNWTEVY